MNARISFVATLSVSFLLFLVAAAFAMEKDGLRVEVVPKVLSDRNPIAKAGEFSTPVDQEMSLKATFKNVSMKDTPECEIDYVVLVQRWTGETPRYSSYKGTEKLPPVRFSQQVEVDIGKYHLGGHMHGVGEQHKDKLTGWKIVVMQGAKKIEFTNPSNIDNLLLNVRDKHRQILGNSLVERYPIPNDQEHAAFQNRICDSCTVLNARVIARQSNRYNRASLAPVPGI
jgi:hypothetical protein